MLNALPVQWEALSLSVQQAVERPESAQVESTASYISCASEVVIDSVQSAGMSG